MTLILTLTLILTQTQNLTQILTQTQNLTLILIQTQTLTLTQTAVTLSSSRNLCHRLTVHFP